MRKVLFLVMALFCAMDSFAQLEYTKSTDVDYSNTIYYGKNQSWKIDGMEHNDQYTAIFIDVSITTNSAGAIFGQYCEGNGVNPNIYIEAAGQRYNCILEKSLMSSTYKLALNSDLRAYIKKYGSAAEENIRKDLKWGVWYIAGNKGAHAYLSLLFPRIPIGIKKINFNINAGIAGDCAPTPIDEFQCESFRFTNLVVCGNEDTNNNTGWTNAKLRNYWAENPCEYIEGIYHFIGADDMTWWGPFKHDFAIKREGYEYKLIYLKGGDKEIWKEGDLKATFVATGAPGIYMASDWLMENKLPSNGDFFMTFDAANMSLYETSSDIGADFLKIFPAYDTSEGTISAQDAAKIADSNEGVNGENNGSSANSNNQWKGSGSGFFISQNGYIATNFHVVNGMTTFQAEYYQGGQKYTYPAKVVITDESNDLAILKITSPEFKMNGTIPYALTTKTKDVGTEVFTLGYPLTFLMGEEVKYTKGEISAKSGFQGDIRTYQISVPITNGNSGGPLFDYMGNVVGITSSGLQKGLADNVNYAIKAIYLQTLVDASQETITLPDGINLTSKERPELIKALQEYVVLIKVK